MREREFPNLHIVHICGAITLHNFTVAGFSQNFREITVLPVNISVN